MNKVGVAAIEQYYRSNYRAEERDSKISWKFVMIKKSVFKGYLQLYVCYFIIKVDGTDYFQSIWLKPPSAELFINNT